MKIIFTGIMFILLSAGISFGQDTDGKMKDMDDMKNNPEMSEMMKSSHHKMMMAHRQNVLTFAKILRDLAMDSENFDAEAARAMVGEITRSSEMMDTIHREHMSKMNAEKREKMAPMMEMMKKKKAELDEHIMALEKSVEAASIDRQEVEKHASAIVEMLEGMHMGDQHQDNMKMDMK